jgi:hypothetical protein
MATIHLIDPEGRSHWTDEDSPFAKSGLESGHLKRPGQQDVEQVDETGEEVEDAAVEQDGVGEDTNGDASGSGDTQRPGRGSRKR